MGKNILLGGSALAATFLTLPPFAQDQTPAQPPQNQTIEQRLKALEDREAARQAEEDMRATRLSTLEQQFADTVWTFDNLRPTIQSADGRFLLSLRFRTQ